MSRYAAIKRDPRTRKHADGTRRSPRMLHVSSPLLHIIDKLTGLKKAVSGRGRTYRNYQRGPKITRAFRRARVRLLRTYQAAAMELFP